MLSYYVPRKFWFVVIVAYLTTLPLMGTAQVSLPTSRQIYQRGTDNYTFIPIQGQCPSGTVRIEATATALNGGTSVGWTAVVEPVSGTSFSGRLRLQGGWYGLSVRAVGNSGTLATWNVDRVGVGEIFIVTGHSVASGDPSIAVPAATDDRVNTIERPLLFADRDSYDKNPIPELMPRGWSQFGAVRPAPFGDYWYFWSICAEKLVKRLNVPVAMYQAAFGGTNLEHMWKSSQGIQFEHGFCNSALRLPYINVKNALTVYSAQSGVRSILSDHGANDWTNPDANQIAGYYKGWLDQARADFGFPVWALINRATVVFQSGDRFPQVRVAQEMAAQYTNCAPGPDYDNQLLPSDRYDNVHMGASGMDRAAQIWADAVSDSFLAKATPFQPSWPNGLSSTPVTPVAPVVAQAPATQNGTIGQSFNASLAGNTFADPGNLALTYSWSNLPSGLSANGLTLSGTPAGPAGTFTATLRATNVAGLSVTTNVTFVYTAAATTPVVVVGTGQGTGLTGDYFDSFDLSGAIKMTRIDATINFNWGEASPGGGVNVDFSTRWTGQIEAPVAGNYVIQSNNDDGTRIWIDGNLIINDWNGHGPTIMTGSINLSAGKHEIKYEYNDTGGGAVAYLGWQIPGTSGVVMVPKDRLYPSSGTATPPTVPVAPVVNNMPGTQNGTIGQGFNASLAGNTFADPGNLALTYSWSNLPSGLSANGLTLSGTPAGPAGTFTATLRATNVAGLSVTTNVTFVYTAAATTPVVVVGAGQGTGLTGDYFDSFDLSGAIKMTRIDATINFNWGEASPGGGVNVDFSTRWTGQIEAPVAGNYVIQSNNDDGTRIWIDGNLIINDWNGHGATIMTGSINLSAGKHEIKYEYVDFGGGGNAYLGWQIPGQSGFSIVPKDRLYPTAGSARMASLSASSAEEPVWNTFPNPATDIVHITYPVNHSGKSFALTMLSMSGERINLAPGAVTNDGNKLSVALPALQTGLYLLIIQLEGKRVHSVKVRVGSTQ
ncbi:hypothetical protein JYG30_19970 [Fibrella sp. USSR17]